MEFIDAEVWPEGSLEVLSQFEVDQLRSSGEGGLYALLRRCMLAVLNSGSNSDDARALQLRFKEFKIGFIQQDQGLKISLNDAPGRAFVDGKMIRGIRELLFAVLRDLVYTRNEILDSQRFDLRSGTGITDAVFHISRNAGILVRDSDLRLAVCWGGHAINREEYEYTKQVGYEFGLRGLDVCTGCGPGAMKGPMKGATIGHAKQRIRNGRYIGITEPGIIAAESPNPIVNSLVIMPDIEKRLEAFVRVGHGIVVFPGGVGTAEEILYLLGILLHPENQNQPLPMIMTGPESAEPYFRQIDAFVGATLGEEAQQRYSIIIGDPREVARKIRDSMGEVRDFRRKHGDAFYFNWRLNIPVDYQMPFEATHKSMSELNIDESLPAHELAAVLRRVFSGIVSGNVREETVEQIEQQGPFTINGSAKIMGLLDELLASFVTQKRMKISGGDYQPCYRVS
ncbi:MAG: nucleotide 5'-monophosphate nucleosidase PpnN [Woeseiaceae bacterium]